MSSDVSCEESSVREGAGYDEAFGSGNESEDFSPSSERETSAQSPDGDESYTEGGKDEVEEGRMEVMGMMLMLTGMMVTVMRNPVEGPQRVQGITVLSFFLRIRPSTSFYL